MLTNTAAPTPQPTHPTATTIAIEDAERRCDAALRDIARLASSGQISPSEAAGLEAESVERLVTRIRDLEAHGDRVVDAREWAAYEARAARRRSTVTADRRPGSESRERSARALRERQMCVVQSARVSSEVLRGLWVDDDEETLATRGALAAAGLL
ncbi:MAG TPA: hypothetical protein VHZ31_03905 [Solirubrobacteraceae bacterium]|jgi:hypothetical protein|nr:hypothetical protein [Solirubrobacteraceae bacterium]